MKSWFSKPGAYISPFFDWRIKLSFASGKKKKKTRYFQTLIARHLGYFTMVSFLQSKAAMHVPNINQFTFLLFPISKILGQWEWIFLQFLIYIIKLSSRRKVVPNYTNNNKRRLISINTQVLMEYYLHEPHMPNLMNEK